MTEILIGIIIYLRKKLRIKAMIIGNKSFKDNRTYILGILNITPDSFYDGARYNSVDAALLKTEKMIEDGADIIDVGGESTRPGYEKISSDEEISRVMPILLAIKKRFDVPVSVDTYKSSVARSVLSMGADMINDIWGLKYDSEMSRLIKSHDASVCIMHNREEIKYNSFFEDVISDLEESIKIAHLAGISDEKIILDPGVGFAKSYEQNLEVLNNLEKILNLGLPVLLGASRKTVIGTTLGLPVEERLEGTLATTAIAVMKGCSFVRVHDVKENKRVIDMTERILYGTNKN